MDEKDEKMKQFWRYEIYNKSINFKCQRKITTKRVLFGNRDINKIYVNGTNGWLLRISWLRYLRSIYLVVVISLSWDVGHQTLLKN